MQAIPPSLPATTSILAHGMEETVHVHSKSCGSGGGATHLPNHGLPASRPADASRRDRGAWNAGVTSPIVGIVSLEGSCDALARPGVDQSGRRRCSRLELGHA